VEDFCDNIGPSATWRDCVWGLLTAEDAVKIINIAEPDANRVSFRVADHSPFGGLFLIQGGGTMGASDRLIGSRWSASVGLP
jgi:hypothetical protein